MITKEAIAEEFSRLAREYHDGDDATKPEAWNLLADFAVENSFAITAALAAMPGPAVKVKPLGKEFGEAIFYDVETLYEATALTPATDLASENERLRAALERQGDNMAFVINHATLPEQWMTKFMAELAEDRAALERT